MLIIWKIIIFECLKIIIRSHFSASIKYDIFLSKNIFNFLLITKYKFWLQVFNACRIPKTLCKLSNHIFYSNFGQHYHRTNFNFIYRCLDNPYRHIYANFLITPSILDQIPKNYMLPFYSWFYTLFQKQVLIFIILMQVMPGALIDTNIFRMQSV